MIGQRRLSPSDRDMMASCRSRPQGAIEEEAAVRRVRAEAEGPNDDGGDTAPSNMAPSNDDATSDDGSRAVVEEAVPERAHRRQFRPSMQKRGQGFSSCRILPDDFDAALAEAQLRGFGQSRVSAHVR